MRHLLMAVEFGAGDLGGVWTVSIGNTRGALEGGSVRLDPPSCKKCFE